MIRDNIVTCSAGNPRPLLNVARDDKGAAAKIENNRLQQVSDTAAYANPATGNHQGVNGSLTFRAGVNSKYKVNGWKITR